MCGIAGFYAREALGDAGPRLLGRMTGALSHRGPDDEGMLVDAAVGLGMRRLSIIDLKTGQQPLPNEDGSLWVIFNGEIYNYRELTAELLAHGHRFSTASDTEVLVHLYEQYGEACAERLQGMFAFAIWEPARRRLFLARDRLGIKPLYYAEGPGGFVFASELKALAQAPWVSAHVDRRALVAYLRFGYVPDHLCILAGVSKVPPGHTLVVRDGRADAPRRYWRATDYFRRPDTRFDEEEAVSALWAHIEASVRSHLVSDVPVGAFLSGGIDSSAVVAAMAQEHGARVKSFSVGFREPRYNELPYARRVAEWFGTEHHELLVEPADVGILETLLRAFDEPFADASAIPTYLVSRLAREHVKVVLSGDGGDELFAGYDRYLVDHRRRLLGVLGDRGFGAPLGILSAVLPEGTPGKNFLHNLSLPRMERYLDSISLFDSRALRTLLEPEAVAGVDDAFAPAVAAGHGLDPLSRLQDLDIGTYLAGDILTKVDRMSMANSLEARVPLLDHRLVEFACRLPAQLRLRSGETKYVLRRALRGRVPAEVLVRPKQGFGVPLEDWFAGDLPQFFQDALGDGGRLVSLGITSSAVKTLTDLYARRPWQGHCRRLWSLVVLDGAIRKLGAVLPPVTSPMTSITRAA